MRATDSSTPTPCVLTFPVSIYVYPADPQLGQSLVYCVVAEAEWLLNGGPPPADCLGVLP